jgi:hypothetical protein
MRSPFYSEKVTATGFCPECCEERTIYRRRLDHRRQAILTAATLGFWAPLWIEMSIKSRRLPWKCEKCRNRVAEPAPETAAAPWEGGSLLAISRLFGKGKGVPK